MTMIPRDASPDMPDAPHDPDAPCTCPGRTVFRLTVFADGSLCAGRGVTRSQAAALLHDIADQYAMAVARDRLNGVTDSPEDR